MQNETYPWLHLPQNWCFGVTGHMARLLGIIYSQEDKAWCHLASIQKFEKQTEANCYAIDKVHAFAEWPSLKIQAISNLYFKLVFSHFKHLDNFYFSIFCQFLLSPLFASPLKSTKQTCFGQVKPIYLIGQFSPYS